MPKLCCFVDPELNDDDRTLTDVCPKCGRQYGFPLFQAPRQIDQYEVVRPIDRGFYSATYLARVGQLGRQRVIKLAPKRVYDAFSKDFEEECKEHLRAAEGSEHIADIHDFRMDIDVVFGDTVLKCHAAVIDYVPGKTLAEYVEGGHPISANAVAQIAIDLFTLLDELESKRIRHNDLHANNLIVEELEEQRKRADAEDPFVRLVAIDLNSVSDASKSDMESSRLGDIHWAVRHLRTLVDRLLRDPDKVSDLDYRLASVLEEKASLMAPAAVAQRIPTFDECISETRASLRNVASPWTEPPRLRRFNDAYNAQNMPPWFVPYLLVDPEERWLAAIATPGPQVMTGMRGCGKTMLLRALQFHARATLPGQDVNAEIAQVRGDGYVGLYASCTRLLDELGSPTKELKEPFCRLYLAYALEALRALRHLRELAPDEVFPGAYRHIGEAVADYVEGFPEARTATSEHEIERLLIATMVKINRGEGGISLPAHPSMAFPHLAEAIRACSNMWRDSAIFFLLDDVSTRFLEVPGVDQLMSTLLFSDPQCAFKLTTEAQTLELILRSPGLVEKARVGRDYDVFDLGGEVNRLIRNSKGSEFVEGILGRRAVWYPNHPKDISPRVVLGDTTLESIAADIARTSDTSARRKSIYHGIRAISGVCVGDIGDVISLYELILRRAAGRTFPIDAQIQSECFQDFCSRRLYDLNRKNPELKRCAISFAEASYELLRKSAGEDRLRQYLKIYVRVTAGDEEFQYQKLREMIDAGLFVLDGGTSRTKMRDADPVKQFVLTFRKLYGLSSFIGLSERDRFELSGEDLEEWLRDPEHGKSILLRNLGGEPELEMEAESPAMPVVQGVQQVGLWKVGDVPKPEEVHPDAMLLAERKAPICKELTVDLLSAQGIDTVVLGLGFEERTLVSAKRVLDVCRPQSTVLVRYLEPGRSREILDIVEGTARSQTEVPYEQVVQGELDVPGGNVLVDVTGLAKPALFRAIRTALRANGVVWVCHTGAKSYYPLDEDIGTVLAAEKKGEYYVLLTGLSRLLTGETGPYSIDPLLVGDADESRRRILCAFASPKHERLMSLLDARPYDRIHVVTQPDAAPRGELAHLAADFAAKNYPGAEVKELESNDLTGVLRYLAHTYHHWYVDRGFNIEYGLTGSKLQAVACAAMSAAVKVSQCWYVRPKNFDASRFTVGTGPSSIFELRVQGNELG